MKGSAEACVGPKVKLNKQYDLDPSSVPAKTENLNKLYQGSFKMALVPLGETALRSGLLTLGGSQKP